MHEENSKNVNNFLSQDQHKEKNILKFKHSRHNVEKNEIRKFFYQNHIFDDAIHHKNTLHFPSDQRFLCKPNINQSLGVATF